jgi:predicted ATP-binding protein involved in virulence
MSNIPLKSVRIEGLFGMFDHTIELKEQNLTILYGANGVGKTTVFKIIDRFFTNLEGISVGKSKSTSSLYKSFIVEYYHKMYAIGEYANYTPFYDIVDETPLPIMKTKLISTQRLQTLEKENSLRIDQTNNKLINNAAKYAKDIVEKYNILLKKYETQANELKMSLGERLKNKSVRKDLSDAELHQIWEEVQQKLADLQAVGLWEEGNKISPPETTTDPVDRAILSVNWQDLRESLKAYDGLYAQLALFLDIINNRRFSFKSVQFKPEEGFIFTNHKGVRLKAEDLSSGEQHEFILMYELLFEIPEHSLVMIDEPEISLHVIWQMEFVNDMLEIIKMRNISIMAATHSPDIINGRWDLTVNLKSNEQEPQPAAE